MHVPYRLIRRLETQDITRTVATYGLQALAELYLAVQALRQMLGDQAVAAADFIALVAVTEHLDFSRRHIRGNHSDEIQRRLLAFIQAVFRNIGHLQEFPHPAAGVYPVQVLTQG